MEIDDAKTPRELFEAIHELLTAKKGTPDPASLAVAYQVARTKIVTFRDTLSALPKLPTHNAAPAAGLQECMEWCTQAKDVIHDTLARMDPQVINGMASILEEVRALPQKACPPIDSGLFDKAMTRAQRTANRWVSRGRTPRRIPFTTHDETHQTDRLAEAAAAVSELTAVVGARVRRERPSTLIDMARGIGRTADAAREEPSPWQIAYDQKQLLIGAERIYRLMDRAYEEGLAALEQAVRDRLNRFNELGRAPTGDMLDVYDKLTGGPVLEAVKKLGPACRLDQIVEDQLLFATVGPNCKYLLFGHKPMDSLIAEIVTSYRSILREVEKLQGTITVPPGAEHDPSGKGHLSENGGTRVNVNIQNSTVTMRDIRQAQDSATGTRSSVGKDTPTSQENKKHTKTAITAFFAFLAAFLTVLQILFGWMGGIWRYLTGK
jgi:hypothetical protein